MARIASNKRMRAVVWTAVFALVFALAAVSFRAYAAPEHHVPASHGTSVETTASSESTAAGDGATAGGSADSPGGVSASSSASSGAAAALPAASAGASSSASQSEVDARLAQSPLPSGWSLGPIEGVEPDTAGSVFTFITPLNATAIEADLYWAGDTLELSGSRVGNDVLAAGRQIALAKSDIQGDIRLVGQRAGLSHVVGRGSADLVALDISVDSTSALEGVYCGGGSISFEGYSRRLVAYGQSIYFDGVVEGDVTLSAQDIVIGPHAKVTGLLDIRSGQTLEVLDIPASAQIAHLDTTLDHPNTIDQITQIRAAIAPYFQVGSILFVVVSFILLGLAGFWGFGGKMSESNRLVRRYPLAVLVLGCIAILLMVVIVLLGTALVFTIPFSIVVGLALVLVAIYCVPFTGASLMLAFRHRLRPALCVALGSGVGGALLFVPYLNTVVFAVSLVYFAGYIVNIGMFGHDEIHDASFHVRQADEDAPGGKARGILPVAAPGESGDPADALAGSEPGEGV